VAAVLIELSGGEGVVRCDDGEIVLTHDVRLEWGQLLQPHDSYWWRMLASACVRLVRKYPPIATMVRQSTALKIR
jgi:hypothetical protein